MKRSRRLVCEKPYGVRTSAKTAASSIVSTMTAADVPRGFRRSIRIQTSVYQGRAGGRA